ncbi:MAG: nucleotide-binding protein [Nitrospirae bacterium]|nr:nucleotide-binding protein [Magnetococcales bacterium]HAT48840.1 DNA-binding protein [Alphaproteobacteria bacterium]
MPNTFHGTLEELKAAVESTGTPGEWLSDGEGKHTFRARSKGVLNWWESKGTLQIQGPAKGKQELEQALNAAISGPGAAALQIGGHSQAAKKGQIFIVHGHDVNARDQLELVLRRLGLEPFILMNSSGEGKTIIEALEGHIGRDYASDFGIVLMTPDDVGYAKQDGEGKAEPRARQNVLLETGMLLSSLTRERMALIVKGHLELPSDLQGIIRLGYNDHIREIVLKLCQRLKEVGFDIDAAAISAASA